MNELDHPDSKNMSKTIKHISQHQVFASAVSHHDLQSNTSVPKSKQDQYKNRISSFPSSPPSPPSPPSIECSSSSKQTPFERRKSTSPQATPSLSQPPPSSKSTLVRRVSQIHVSEATKRKLRTTVKGLIAFARRKSVTAPAVQKGMSRGGSGYGSDPEGGEGPVRPRVFLDIGLAGSFIGRVVFELFSDIVPLTCENFMKLCTGECGLSSTGTPLHYKHTRFFRIIRNFIIQGGDVTHDDGSGGQCIWAKERDGGEEESDEEREGGGEGWHGRYFKDESFELSHAYAGLLSMATEGPDTNQSQFFITCAPCKWMDGRSVVFGKTLRGFNTLAIVESFGSSLGIVHTHISVLDCGIVNPDLSTDEWMKGRGTGGNQGADIKFVLEDNVLFDPAAIPSRKPFALT